LNYEGVTLIAKFQGSIIPDLIDSDNINYSIDTIINNNYKSTGIFCELNRDALNNYDPEDFNSAGRIDMVGHSLVQYNVDNINFLSYNLNIREYLDYEENISHSSINNNIEYNFSQSATGTDRTPSKLYNPALNGWNLNENNKVLYYTSYYGQGNSGRFNNTLNINLKYFNDAEISELNKIKANKSILYNGQRYCLITTKSIIKNTNSEQILQLGISHPEKYYEGANYTSIISVNKNIGEITVSDYSNSLYDIQLGDWVYAKNENNIYYFRVIGITGSNNEILTVDTSTVEYQGSEYINYIDNSYKLYFGSNFDAVNVSTMILSAYINPDKFIYDYNNKIYIAYDGHKLYNDFKTGLLSDGDICYTNQETLEIFIHLKKILMA